MEEVITSILKPLTPVFVVISNVDQRLGKPEAFEVLGSPNFYFRFYKTVGG